MESWYLIQIFLFLDMFVFSRVLIVVNFCICFVNVIDVLLFVVHVFYVVGVAPPHSGVTGAGTVAGTGAAPR